MRKLLTIVLTALCGLTYGQIISSFPAFEDFENEIQCPTGCGPTCNLRGIFTNVGNADLEWTSDVGGTTSSATGPSIDHTLGTAAGKYVYMETSCNGTGYPSKTAFLVSDTLDFTNLSAPSIEFWYHMFGTSMGTMHLDVDTTGGGTWVNDIIPSWTDNRDLWQLQSASLAAYAGRSSIRVRIRGISGSSFGSDMAVDDIEIFEPAPIDLDLISVTPSTGCGLTSTETISLMIKNAGTDTITAGTAFPVSYQLDGGVIVTDTVNIAAPVAFCDTITFSFATTGDLSSLGGHTLDAWTAWNLDSLNGNDTMRTTPENVLLVNSFPYCETFENGRGGFLTAGSNSTWAFGTPGKTVINSAASGDSAWVTGGLGTGTYANNEDSYVRSPCYDLSGLCNPQIELSVWWNSEFSWDGAVLQYSIDGGDNWANIGAFGDPNNWYTDNTINGNPGGQQEGWSGRNSTNNGSNGWVTARHDARVVAGESEVFFRIAFGSDGSVADEGFAFDDFTIFNGVFLGKEDLLICSPDSTVLTAQREPGNTVMWSTMDTTTSITVTTTGFYSVALTSDTNCISRDTIFVRALPSNFGVDLGPDSSYCGGPVLLDPGNYPQSSFLWSTGDSSTTLSVSNTGTYGVAVTNQCGTAGDSVQVVVNALPNVNIGPDTAVCGNTTLDAGAGFSSIVWSTSDTVQTLVIANSGTYGVTVTDANGCVNSDSAAIVVNTLPTVNLGADQTLCVGSSSTLNPNLPAGSFNWSNGDTSATSTVSMAGTYSLMYTDSNGCMGMDTIVLTSKDVPTAALSVDTSLCPIIAFTDASTGDLPTSWAWNFGDGNTSTSQNPTNDYSLAGNGTYTVTLIATNDCGNDTITQSITIECVVNLAPERGGMVLVYPNPSNGRFNLSFSDVQAKDASFQVFDLYGKAVYGAKLGAIQGAKAEVLDLQGISKGVYFLKVDLDGDILTQKIVLR